MSTPSQMRVPSVSLLRAFLKPQSPPCTQIRSKTSWMPREKYAKTTPLDKLHRRQKAANIQESMLSPFSQSQQHVLREPQKWTQKSEPQQWNPHLSPLKGHFLAPPTSTTRLHPNLLGPLLQTSPSTSPERPRPQNPFPSTKVTKPAAPCISPRSGNVPATSQLYKLICLMP